MSGIKHRVDLHLSLVLHDNMADVTSSDIADALKHLGVVIACDENRVMVADSTNRMTTVFLKAVIGEPWTYQIADNEHMADARTITTEELAQLKANSVCVEMDIQPIPSAVNLRGHSDDSEGDYYADYAAKVELVNSIGFAVDPRLFKTRYLTVQEGTQETFLLNLKVAASANTPMSLEEGKGAFALAPYDPAMLGFKHQGQLITHPYYSADGRVNVNPVIYGFSPSEAFHGKLTLDLGNGKSLVLSPDMLACEADDEAVSVILKYNARGYLVAECPLKWVPVQGR